MAQNLKEFYDQNPVTLQGIGQPVGRAMRGIGDAVQATGRAMGTRIDNAPKLLNTPAVGALNVTSRLLSGMKEGFTGTPQVAPQFQALKFSEMFGDKAAAPVKPGVVATAAKPVPVAAKPVPTLASNVSYSVGSDLPSSANEQAGTVPAAAAPLGVNVTRQANGNLSFSGQGGGEGVSYTGLPNWSSAQGGAGKGGIGYSTGGSMGNSGFDLANQNTKMASALQGIQNFDRQKEADRLIGAVAGGAGGAVGVARNTLAMQQLGPLLERQMSTTSAENINQTNDATRRNDAALGFAGDMARVAASRYGTDVGAKTADKGFEVEKQKAAAAIVAARSKVAAGKPPSVKDQTALFVFSGRNADGTQRTPAQQAALEMRYAATFGNRDSYMGLIGGEEE